MRVWALGLKIRFLEHQTQECWAKVKLEKEMLAPNLQTRQVSETSQVQLADLMRAAHHRPERKASLRIPV